MIQLNVQFNNISYIQPLLTSIGDNDDSGNLIDQICKNQKQKSELEALVWEKMEESADIGDIDPYEQDLQFYSYLKRLVVREIRAMHQIPHLSAFSAELETAMGSTHPSDITNCDCSEQELTLLISDLVSTYQRISHSMQNKGSPS